MKEYSRKRKNLIVWAGILCVIAILAEGNAVQKKENKNAAGELPQIIVGSDDYPPFNYSDENGQPTGIDVDLAKEAFGRMGYRAVFRQINWEEKKEMLDAGEIDCVWGSFSMDGREEEYNWAGPYMVSRQVVAVNESSDIYTLKDLEGKRVAVQSTTKPEEIFGNHEDSRIPNIKDLFSMQNRELIYPFLSKGYVDAVAAHETAILQYMKDYNLQYRILEEPLLTVGLGVAFNKEDKREIAETLTETFKEMRADGSAEKIISNYLDGAEKYLEVDAYENE
nr:transporter substrate-binding domain-containing protein [uncultured Blautia sp.]